MRRLLAVTALVAALAIPVGCAADGPAGGGPETAGGSATPTSAPAAPTAGGGAAGGNAAQVCAAAQQAGSTGVRRYVEELGRMVQAVGAGDQAGADAARQRARAALAEWRTVLRQQSAQATDAQLKTLLTDIGAEVDALGADVDSIDETELDRLQQRLDQLCTR